MVGCLGDLYESLEILSDTFMESAFMEPTAIKAALLKPIICSYAPGLSLLLPNIMESSKSTNLYRCYNLNNCPYVTNNSNNMCPKCWSYTMTQRVKFANTTTSGGGFVKADATFMVMDNLMVKPMSTASIISLLNEFNVEDVGAIEEREVQIGVNEGVKLLKMCLQSKTVLTDLFLVKKVGGEK
ncbi:hypothetical protein COLO4_10934 [Corchorus olitorius]|uniref:Uncharacterized protein n=1 Tax=Corchorus olitorius TaxID=93759 RepID=A0A1R3K6C7_9ROSI|nr:hypothetical protein COLO4_10934 [Corchorus olitorius]